jgi:hypothetical protein
MDYTSQGVLAAQVRVHERLHLLLAERGIVLDPGSPLWFDGRLDLPKPGEPWKMALSCRGATASVNFTPTELDAFLAQRPGEVVSGRLRQAAAARSSSPSLKRRGCANSPSATTRSEQERGPCWAPTGCIRAIIDVQVNPVP